MTIRRTNKTSQKNYLKENKNLKILDLGCTHINYWKEANHFADIVDYSEEFSKKNLKFTLLYPNKNFLLETKNLIM